MKWDEMLSYKTKLFNEVKIKKIKNIKKEN